MRPSSYAEDAWAFCAEVQRRPTSTILISLTAGLSVHAQSRGHMDRGKFLQMEHIVADGGACHLAPHIPRCQDEPQHPRDRLYNLAYVVRSGTSSGTRG